jgi:hypothetical protein
MIEISNLNAPLLIQLLRDGVRYNEQLLTSETLRDRSDYEQYFLDATQLFAELQEEYKKIENQVGITLEDLL